MSDPFNTSAPTRAAVMEPPAPPKSRRTLWIILSAVAAVVVLAGGGGAFAYAQFTAPGKAAAQFCTDLKTQSYSVAYDQLSGTQQAQFTRDQFVQGSELLDQLEGKVTLCNLAGSSGAYGYSLGSSTASLTTVLTRQNAGTLQGVVHLKNENGGWKIDGLDTSLLGVNLIALRTAGAFCAAVQSQAYTTAYALLGSLAQTAVSQDQFVLASQAHDQIDGTITGCSLVGLGPKNTDSNASLMVSITRAKLGQREGTVSLDVEGGAWKIAAIADALQGTDLGPLQVGTQVCADLVSGSYAAIYSLTSSRTQASLTQAQLAAFFDPGSGIKYTGCKPDLSTYKVSGTNASYHLEVFILDTKTGGTFGIPSTILFLNENGAWKLDGFDFGTSADKASMKPASGSLLASVSQMLAGR